MKFVAKSKLPRLAREYYQGGAVVMWTHTLEGRARGWLDEAVHRRFREFLLHVAARYSLACPCYVLMPDHWHLVWMGLKPSSDQLLATAFFRKHMQAMLGSVKLQDRAHDHVLRDEERKRGAFQAMCQYVLHNPERAGLCEDWREWPQLGAVVAGYPVFDPREPGFWEDFWKVRERLVAGRTDDESLRSRAGPQDGSSPAREGREAKSAVGFDDEFLRSRAGLRQASSPAREGRDRRETR